MACEQWGAKLDTYLDGELSTEETRAFETALRDRSDAVARELVMIKRTPEEPRARARFFDRAI